MMRYKKRTRERILMIVATVVACGALARTYTARVRSFGDVERQLASGAVFNLRALESPEALSNQITLLPARPENQFIAAQIYRAVAGPEAYLHPKSVSDLLRIKVRAS